MKTYQISMSFYNAKADAMLITKKIEAAVEIYNLSSNQKKIVSYTINRNSILITLETDLVLKQPSRALHAFTTALVRSLSVEEGKIYVKDHRCFKTISTDIEPETQPTEEKKLYLLEKTIHMMNSNDFVFELEELLQKYKA